MALTIKDCLEVPALSGATVVSGHKGLNRIVNAVSVLEFIDIKMFTNKQLYANNELVLTAFHSIKDNVDEQVKSIELLYRSGDVGIVLYYVNYCLPEVDERLIKISNELDFPIIVVPEKNNAAYTDAITDIMEAIIYDKQQESRFTDALLERISQLPKQQLSVYNVVQMVSDQIKSSILLVDTRLNCLLHSRSKTPTDISENEIIGCFIDRDFSDRIDTVNLTYVDKKIDIYRVPFKEEKLSHLSLIIVDEHCKCTKEDLYSAVDVLQLFSRIWKKNFDEVKANALVPAILTDNEERTLRIANSLNFDLHNINSMFLIEMDNSVLSKKQIHDTERKLIKRINEIMTSYGKIPITDVFTGYIVTLVNYAADESNDNDLLEEISACAGEMLENHSITTCNNMINTQNIRNAFVFYCEHVGEMKKIFPKATTFNMANLYFAEECKTAAASKDPYNAYFQKIINIILDEEDGEDLMETFLTYVLDADYNTQRSGEMLYVHRNTIQYRINKIKRILNLSNDINKMPEAYILNKAAAIYRLNS